MGTAALAGDNSQETKNLGVVNIGIGAVGAISGVLAIAKAGKHEPAGTPAVVGEVQVHFGAGVVGRGLGVRLTF